MVGARNFDDRLVNAVDTMTLLKDRDRDPLKVLKRLLYVYRFSERMKGRSNKFSTNFLPEYGDIIIGRRSWFN